MRNGSWLLALLVACTRGPAASEESSAAETGLSGTLADLHGWLWQDIAANLPRLKQMGFTAVQLSPHTATCGGQYSDGYDPSNFDKFWNRFGDQGQLQYAIGTAHYFGLQIYADMIFNQMCTHPDYRYDRFSWNDFHHDGTISDWNNQWQLENCDLFGLNDLAQESDYVRGELWNYLVATNNLGFDGYRLDAVKHVPQWYWRDHVVSNLRGWGKYVYGEVYDGDNDYLQSYADLGMAVTDYSLYFALRSAFSYGGDVSQLDGAGYAMRNGAGALTFVENRDVPAPQNRSLARAFIAAYVGYPEFTVDLNDGELANLAWVHGHLAYGNYLQRWKNHDVLVFERENHLLAGFNQGGDWAHVTLQTTWWGGQRLHDYSGHAGDQTVGDGGWVSIDIPPVGYVMLAP
jgi:alpha-amylase